MLIRTLHDIRFRLCGSEYAIEGLGLQNYICHISQTRAKRVVRICSNNDSRDGRNHGGFVAKSGQKVGLQIALV